MHNTDQMPQRATSRARPASVRGARVLVIGISAATGACFSVLAGLSVSAMAAPFRRFQVFSVVIAAVAIAVGYLAFRAATTGHTDKVTAVESLFRGMVGAFIGLIVIIAFLLMFRPDSQRLLAHALGRPASSFTIFRLLVASVLLGFGAGFVLRIRTTHKLSPRL